MYRSIQNIAVVAALIALAGCSGAGAGGEDGQIAVAGVSAGDSHTLVLLEDGTLWSTGNNGSGRLGNGTETRQNSLVQVMSGVASVSAGWQHTLVVRRDGTLWGFGNRNDGLLGSSTPGKQLEPIHIMDDVRQAAAGQWHSMVVKTDGTLWAFGSNSDGQLGIGSIGGFRRTPVQVTALGSAGVDASNIASVSAGAGHSIALTRAGKLYVFGRNNRGQLGLGDDTDRGTPWVVPNATAVAGISAGVNHSLYWTANGDLYAFGYNVFGELGDTTEIQRNEPKLVMTNVATASAGNLAYSAAVKTDGTLWTFGYNFSGQLGTGVRSGFNDANPNPQRVLDRVVSVAAGGGQTMIVRSDGSLWGTGRASRGDGTTEAIATPTFVPTPAN